MDRLILNLNQIYLPVIINYYFINFMYFKQIFILQILRLFITINHC